MTLRPRNPTARGYRGNFWGLHPHPPPPSAEFAQKMRFPSRSPGFQQEKFDSDFAPGITLSGKLAPGATVTVEKIVVLHTSRDADDPVMSAVTQHETILHKSSFGALLASHQQAWRNFLELAGIITERDESAQ